MSLWVQFNYRRATRFHSDLSPYWFLLGPSPLSRESRARASTADWQPTGSRLVSRSSSTRKTRSITQLNLQCTR